MLEIVLRLAEQGYQIDPQALELIRSCAGNRDDLVYALLKRVDSSVTVIEASHIFPLLPSVHERSIFASDSEPAQSPPMLHGVSAPHLAEAMKNREGEHRPVPFGLDAALAAQAELHLPSSNGAARQEIEVNFDITGNSTCMGEYQDFVRYFRDRYAKIREILSRRLNSRPIESLGRSTAGREISIIGMVMDIRTTAKGHRILELEDPTGMVAAIIQKDSEPFELSRYIIPDEVIGITAVSDGNGRVFVKSILWPDMPSQCWPLAEASGGIVLTSDLHAGSEYFMEEAWMRFVAWLNGEADDPSGIASEVRYVVIAGDLVDGIGVYPGQERDLAIKDIYEQYELAAQCLNCIRKDVKIVISPGNHDIVRQAEPQPALPQSVQKYFSGDVLFVGDPAWVTLNGTSLLVYHGRSIDDLVLRIPGLSYGEPEKAMVEMLRRRHLSPIYGGRVSIAPEHQDHYVIHKPPAVLHCGHVHTVGIARYKGVAAINSGTWQLQTEYQRKMNIQPTPAAVPIVDMATMKIRKLLFA